MKLMQIIQNGIGFVDFCVVVKKYDSILANDPGE